MPVIEEGDGSVDQGILAREMSLNSQEGSGLSIWERLIAENRVHLLII